MAAKKKAAKSLKKSAKKPAKKAAKKAAKKPAAKFAKKPAKRVKAKMKATAIAKPAAVPVAERRGVSRKVDFGQHVLLIQNPNGKPADADAFLDRMIKLGHTGAARRNVAAELFDGKIQRPMGPWGYLVQLTGQPWLYFFGDGIDRAWPRDLAAKLNLRTLLMSLDGMIGRHEAEAWEGKTQLLEFQGDDDREMKISGARFSTEWLREYRKLPAAFDAIAREFDAYVPVLDNTSDDGNASIEARDGKAFKPDDFARIDLVVFGDASTLEPTPAAFALAKAIASGDAAGVRAAIKAGADPRYLPDSDNTPIYQALAWDRNVSPDKQVDVLRALLESGADPNFSPDGEPLIHWAVHWTHIGAGGGDNEFTTIPRLKLLLEHGANPNVLGTFLTGHGETPLHVAVWKGWFNMARLLLEHGADPTMRNHQGKTPADDLREQIAESPDGKWTREGQSVAAVKKFIEVLERGEEKT